MKDMGNNFEKLFPSLRSFLATMLTEPEKGTRLAFNNFVQDFITLCNDLSDSERLLAGLHELFSEHCAHVYQILNPSAGMTLVSEYVRQYGIYANVLEHFVQPRQKRLIDFLKESEDRDNPQEIFAPTSYARRTWCTVVTTPLKSRMIEPVLEELRADRSSRSSNMALVGQWLQKLLDVCAETTTTTSSNSSSSIGSCDDSDAGRGLLHDLV
eukprot:m.163033 g.163033  ORF g.163033 m.163033 type:complete len:212 (-) comp17105_c0_seq2:3010-3645(-)